MHIKTQVVFRGKHHEHVSIYGPDNELDMPKVLKYWPHSKSFHYMQQINNKITNVVSTDIERASSTDSYVIKSHIVKADNAEVHLNVDSTAYTPELLVISSTVKLCGNSKIKISDGSACYSLEIPSGCYTTITDTAPLIRMMNLLEHSRSKQSFIDYCYEDYYLYRFFRKHYNVCDKEHGSVDPLKCLIKTGKLEGIADKVCTTFDENFLTLYAISKDLEGSYLSQMPSSIMELIGSYIDAGDIDISM